MKNNCRTYWLFSFHLDNYYKPTVYLQKVVIFNIYHIFAQFMKLHGCRFLYIFSLCDVRNKVVFLILEHSSLRGGGGSKQEQEKKKHEKHEILVFIIRDPIGKLDEVSERFSEALTSKLSNEKKCCWSLQKWCEIELFSPLDGFIMNLQQIHLFLG